jgi:ABC-2 type transport system permease protein
MKNNLLSLIDISFRENLYFSSNSNKKNRTFFASLALYSVIYIILSLYLAVAFSATLSTTGASYKNMLAVLVVMATLMIFNQSIIAVKKVFISKDYDILISLPLKKTEIIVSKVASLLAMGLLNSVLLIMPAGIYICVISKTTGFLIEALIASLFTPIFPLGVALIFGTIFSYISAHAKKFSNIVDIFFNLLMVATIFVVTFTFSSGLLTNGDLSFVAGPYYLLHNAESNKLYYLYYVLINVAACVLIVYFISLFYVKVHEALSRTYKAKYVRKDSVCKSESKALFNNEANCVFVFVLNRYFQANAHTIIFQIFHVTLSLSNGHTLYHAAHPIAVLLNTESISLAASALSFLDIASCSHLAI